MSNKIICMQKRSDGFPPRRAVCDRLCWRPEAAGSSRPIADVSRSCQPASMIRLTTLLLCAVVTTMATPVAGQSSVEGKTMPTVRGYLNAHWEYPGFLPDPQSGLKYMDFQLREEKWQQVYSKPANDAYIHHPDETKCFRVIGEGYLAPRQPTFMQNWEGDQFIFVKIRNSNLRLPQSVRPA